MNPPHPLDAVVGELSRLESLIRSSDGPVTLADHAAAAGALAVACSVLDQIGLIAARAPAAFDDAERGAA